MKRKEEREEYVLRPLNMYIGGYRRCLPWWERGTGRRQYVSRGLDIDEDDLIPKIMSNNVLRCTKLDRQVVDPTHGQNTAQFQDLTARIRINNDIDPALNRTHQIRPRHYHHHHHPHQHPSVPPVSSSFYSPQSFPVYCSPTSCRIHSSSQ